MQATSDGNFGIYNVTQNYTPIEARDDTDGASSIGVQLRSRAFTTAGAKIVSFINNTTEKAYVDKNGGFTSTQPALGTTPTDGFLAQNTTAATSGNQQVSPASHWSGRGWKSGGA